MEDRLTEDALIKELTGRFCEVMDNEPDALCFAPGRVNLIGEHIDYNGGHVFPCALTLGTYGAARKREDSKIRLYSMDFTSDGVLETDLEQIDARPDVGWGRYVIGVVWAFRNQGLEITSGFDFVCKGTLPAKSGLSSSASLEVLTGTVLRNLYGVGNADDPAELPLLAQKAENEYVGMNCGIMDQFASANGRKDSAILLDCETLDFKYAPLKLDDYSIVIVNTNKPHELVDSAYNDRRNECEEALSDLRKAVPELTSLCALSAFDFERYADCIKKDISRRRALHAVSEEARTLEAFNALTQGSLDEFGRLMYESHASLRDDFEVSCPELDFLVDNASECEGVIGARMTGGGFGGCTVNIVKNDYVKKFMDGAGASYVDAFGYEASFYTVTAGEGARVLQGK